MMRIQIILLLLTLFIFACKKESKGFDENKLVKAEDLGEYHALDEEKIKIYLPAGFRKLNEHEIVAFIDSIKQADLKDYYRKNHEMRKAMKGNFYSFYGEDYATEITVHTLPYMPFSKQNAKELLYFIRKGQEAYQEVTGIFHNKITSTYQGDRSLQIFKAKYRLSYFIKETEEQEAFEMFSTTYLISSNFKTFLIKVDSPFDEDYSAFIKKIKM